ncbi:uncharacterized protein LOC110722503 [Chenopodium quinoa]|uniref:uncharacterized protein LOC110722503 n=1 Tax=Chenopodium quinoa TaxID=63459 RepID=UPI000B77CD44|nr:uncharacterized protein LOC110722503 [Chenopodium quinoa]
MWEWVTYHVTKKRLSSEVEPSTPLLTDEQVQNSLETGCFPCLLPYKRRKGAWDQRTPVAQKLAPLSFLGCSGVDVVGLSGGMFVFWFTPLGLVPVYSSQNVFLCKLEQGDEIKHIMFVYGSPHVSFRLEVWNLITNILETIPNVVLIGDFNQVEYLSDKLGDSSSIPGQMDFISWRIGMDLVDVPFSGPKFTWTNNRTDLDPIFERLDRAYASSAWLLDYPDTRVLHQPILFLDHAAIILSDMVESRYLKRPYRVENWFVRERLLAWCISHKKAWGINWKTLVSEVQQASLALSSRIDRCLFITTKDEKVVKAQAAFLFWRQRAKVKWDALGDFHSRLLFSLVQSQRRQNKICGLRDSSGVWQRDLEYIASIYFNFYKDLYSVSDYAYTQDSNWWDQLHLPYLSSAQQRLLMAPFSAQEIQSAIFGIDDNKSPGPNGFSSAFFKAHWADVGSSVVSAVQHFFAHGYMLKEWNRTFLVLLPKVENPELISQFRPIGLCNVIYKCVAKCLTGRLRLVLPSLVADYQNAFVLGRLLSDNTLIAHEVINFMNNSKAKKRFYASHKLDMNKAYDRVSPTACDNLMALLTEFCGLSGQVINLQKSFVKFRPNTVEDYRDYLSSSLKLHCKPSLGSYLGLPVEFSRSKVADFGFLIDKVVKRLSDFATVGLSSAAKLVIINSNLVASFNHILSVFKVPPSVCSRIDILLARFWWKSDSQSRGLAMRSKSLLHLPKGLGGLGIRQLESFNSALLARQCWRIHQHPQLLVSRLLTAKYPSLRSFKTRTIPRSSWGCRSLLTGLSTLDRALRIMALDRPLQPMDDFVYWKFSRNGSFTTKSAYAMLLSRSVSSEVSGTIPATWWKHFWRLPLLPKLQCFCWKLLHNALPLSGNLQRRGISIDPTCVFCYQERETSDHLFRDCSFTSYLWACAPITFSPSILHGKPFNDWFVDTVSKLRSSRNWDVLASFVSFCWAVWIARNHKIFRQAVLSPGVIFHLMQDWISRSVLAQGFRSLVREFRSLVCSLGNSSLTTSVASDSCYLQGSSAFDVCLLFDGAWSSKNLNAGAGWIFREVFSDSVLGGGSRACHSSSALQSELQACLWALRAAGRRGFRRLLIYSDCSNLFSLLRDGGDEDISCHWLLHEIRLSVLQFSICKLRKVPRQWVAPAHWLTAQARRRQLLSWAF